MGLFEPKLSGTTKMMAAQNALIAKYMVDNVPSPTFDDLEDVMQGLLINSGMSYEKSVHTLGGLDIPHTYLMVAAAYAYMNIPPALHGICFKNNWNFIQRPLIALHDAEKEILMAQNTILEKHGLHISFDC
jgi:hypothetical protein